MKTRMLILPAVFAAISALAAAAWACTPQATILPDGPQSVLAGARIPVEGVTGGLEAPGPVEVRWNSPTGPVVGASVSSAGASSQGGPSYRVEIGVPADARPGVYYLVLSAGGRALARTPVEVMAGEPGRTGGGRVISEGLWNGFDSGSISGAQTTADTAPGTGFPSPAALMIVTGAVGGAAALGVAAVSRARLRSRR